MPTHALIEAILFAKSEPISKGTLARLLSVSFEEISSELLVLEQMLRGRGIRLMRNGDEVMLATAPEAGVMIQKIAEEELSADLGKAGLETLTIVLYNSPIAKSRIDYIRGVNSAFILRNLLVRGLILRTPDENDKRVFLYSPTFDTLRYLGVKSVTELPEYETSRAEVKSFEEYFHPGDQEDTFLPDNNSYQ